MGYRCRTIACSARETQSVALSVDETQAASALQLAGWAQWPDEARSLRRRTLRVDSVRTALFPDLWGGVCYGRSGCAIFRSFVRCSCLPGVNHPTTTQLPGLCSCGDSGRPWFTDASSAWLPAACSCWV